MLWRMSSETAIDSPMKFEAKLLKGMLCFQSRWNKSLAKNQEIYTMSLITCYQPSQFLAAHEILLFVVYIRNTEVDFVWSGLEETMLSSWENVKHTAQERVRYAASLHRDLCNISTVIDGHHNLFHAL